MRYGCIYGGENIRENISQRIHPWNNWPAIVVLRDSIYSIVV